MRGRFIVIVLIFACAAVGVWYLRDTNAGHDPDDPNLVLYGNVDVRRVHLSFRVPGRLQSLCYEEGDALEPNAVIGHLNTDPFQQDLYRAQAERQQAEAALARLENGARPQEIEQAQALVRELQATLTILQADFERYNSLLTKDAVPQQTLDNALARRREAEARLQAAQAALDLVREGPRQEDLAAARATLAQSRAVESQAQLRMEDTTLRVPAQGILLTRVEEPGAMVNTGQTVAVMSLTAPVWVRAYIPEPDLGRVRPGMPAEVITDSRPDRPYHAQVGFISPEAEFTPKNVQTPHLRTDLVFRVRIVVEQPDTGLRQGMPVTVRLQETSAPHRATPERQ